MLAGALLFGATNVGMILGHWYLLMRRLSFEYLERFAKLLLVAVAVRGALAIFILVSLKSLEPPDWGRTSLRICFRRTGICSFLPYACCLGLSDR